MLSHARSMIEPGGATDPNESRARTNAHREATKGILETLAAQTELIDAMEAKGGGELDAQIFSEWIATHRKLISLTRQAVDIYGRYYDALWTDRGLPREIDPGATAAVDQDMYPLSLAISREEQKVVDLSAALLGGTQKN